LVRKPEGKGLLERSTYGWKYNNKFDLKVIGKNGVDLFSLHRDKWWASVKMIMNFWFHSLCIIS